MCVRAVDGSCSDGSEDARLQVAPRSLSHGQVDLDAATVHSSIAAKESEQPRRSSEQPRANAGRRTHLVPGHRASGQVGLDVPSESATRVRPVRARAAVRLVTSSLA